jgi:GMP synthase-like glutamine amidotransferase
VQQHSVYVIEPTFGINRYFEQRGWRTLSTEDVVDRKMEPDVVAWMGGTDINPQLYGEANLYSQAPATQRDAWEVALHKRFKDKPKIGVCRGAQLLNVLNGGRLYQHVDHHAGAHHAITDIHGEQTVVCSVHHQMMIIPSSATLVGWSTNLSTLRLAEGIEERGPLEAEPEVVFFEEDKALCFQAHPEFGPPSCTDYFFRLVDKYIVPLI